jgi:hypothetical protein
LVLRQPAARREDVQLLLCWLIEFACCGDVDLIFVFELLSCFFLAFPFFFILCNQIKSLQLLDLDGNARNELGGADVELLADVRRVQDGLHEGDERGGVDLDELHARGREGGEAAQVVEVLLDLANGLVLLDVRRHEADEHLAQLALSAALAFIDEWQGQ